MGRRKQEAQSSFWLATADRSAHLTDHRRPDRIPYESVELFRQHLCALAVGYAHQDDQNTLAHDVAMKRSVWDRRGRRGTRCAATSR